MRIKFLVLCLIFFGYSGVVQSSELPSIEDTIHPEIWLTAGPFASGARESATTPFPEHGGFGNIEPQAGMEHHSILYNQGKVTWRNDTINEDGVLQIQYDDVEPDWEDLRQYKGRTFTRIRTFAHTQIEIDQPRRALVAARGIGSFRLNGKVYSGDFYNKGYLNVPVVLEEGTNDILLAIGGNTSSEGYFAIMPVEDELIAITDDLTEPHLVRNKDYRDLHLGMPVSNTTNEWKHDVQARVYYTLPNGEEKLIAEKTLPSIGPLAYQHSALSLDMSELEWNEIHQQDSLPLSITLSHKEQNFHFETHLPIKEEDEPFNVTFPDADNSVQFYSAFPPENKDPDHNYPAIFFLHGASVDATGSNGFTQKDWSWIIAPTNRRPFGFDWEKQGRINALNSLDHARDNFGLNEDQIYLTGHSMGGHGAWVLGTGHPHLFAAVAPSAAWASFDIYTPFLTRQDHLLGNPANLQLLKSLLQPTRTLSMVENLRHVPAYILQGGDDRSVPPDHPRMFNKRLSNLGYEVTYNEVPGKGHWWRFDDTEGADCVNHEELMEFIKGRERVTSPDTIRFRTAGLSESHQAYWAKVLQRENFTDDSRLKIVVEDTDDGYVIHAETFNIQKFELNLEEAPLDPNNTTMILNGEEMPVPDMHSMTIFLEERDLAPGEPVPEYQKSPEKQGPIARAFYEPFALVFATQGEEVWQQQTYNQARRMAQSWYYRGNGRTIIIPDTLVDEETEENYNIVLFGSPETNAYYGKLNEQLPVRVYEDSVVAGRKYTEELNIFQRILGRDAAVFGDQAIYNADLSVKFIYPNPENPERFVQVNGGATLNSQALSMAPAMLSSADGLPDFLIFDEQIREKGFASLINAGFFDNRWRYNEEHSFRQPLKMRY